MLQNPESILPNQNETNGRARCCQPVINETTAQYCHHKALSEITVWYSHHKTLRIEGRTKWYVTSTGIW